MRLTHSKPCSKMLIKPLKINENALWCYVMKSSPAEKCTRITKNQWFWQGQRAQCHHKSKSIKKDNVFQYLFEPCHDSMMPTTIGNQWTCMNIYISNRISIVLASWAANASFFNENQHFHFQPAPEEPRAARSSREQQPWAAQSSAGAARSSQEQPGAGRSSQEQPGEAKSSQA